MDLFFAIVFVLGLGVVLQRIFEIKMGIDEGWFHTICMSFWVAMPVSGVVYLLLFVDL
ncbi:hypothetical protein N8014_03740 [Pseudomonadota bacterium]|nr:hypothetical protein [Pseudomonadota bacterium]